MVCGCGFVSLMATIAPLNIRGPCVYVGIAFPLFMLMPDQSGLMLRCLKAFRRHVGRFVCLWRLVWHLVLCAWCRYRCVGYTHLELSMAAGLVHSVGVRVHAQLLLQCDDAVHKAHRAGVILRYAD